MTTLYSPVDLVQEGQMMSKGRLIKARLPDQEPPNVAWYWVKVGNCWSCKYFAGADNPPRCTNPNIPNNDFLYKWLFVNTCPKFEIGMEKGMVKDGGQEMLDVMKAAKLVEGEPSQRVDIIRNEEWSTDLAIRAHRESEIFLDMARLVDYIAQGGKNTPDMWDYVDLSDDLERP